MDVLRRWVREQIAGGGRENAFDACMDHFGALLVGEALRLTGGNRSQAARLLGLSRPTLHAKIDKYHLTLETAVKVEGS